MSVISKGNTLRPGQSLQLGEALTSRNGRYRLELQASDGNLVLYHLHPNGGQHPLWATMKQQEPGHPDFCRELVMQADGNLVLYRAGAHNAGNARWSTATHGDQHRGAYLELRNTGNLIVYSAADKVLWHSNTRAYAHWMEELDDDLTLQNICVPGSHDAGMYRSKLVPLVGARGLALTQSLSIYEQLREGSRYFDLRPRYIEGKGYYLYHGLADGPKLDVVLQDLKRFFDEGSKETVMVQFSKWEDFDGKNADFVQTVLNQLPSKCLFTPADLVVAKKDALAALRKNNPALTTKPDLELLPLLPPLDLATLPLSALRGKLLVLIDNDDMYNNVIKPGNKAGLYSRKLQLPLYDEYSNKQDYDDMLRDQTDKFVNFKGKEGLFMLNWTLTPLSPDDYRLADLGENKGRSGFPLIELLIDQVYPNAAPLVASTAVETYAERINPQLEGAANSRPELFGRNAAGRMVNIINLDYLETAEAVRVCQKLIEANNKAVVQP